MIGIIVTTYNSSSYINRLLRSIEMQSRDDLHVIFADDGSTDNTVELLEKFKSSFITCDVLALPHQERGLARKAAIERAKELNVEYMMILDADMVIETNTINECMAVMTCDPHIGALVLKETPVSQFSNPMTKIKIFERTVINNSKRTLDVNSIEAARFWRSEAYKKSGGINEKQIAFEETQPTIRYIEMGGLIIKHTGHGVLHDEKKVTLKNILSKKKYHFKMMDKTFKTEENGLLKAFKRWYFFRPVMYRKVNLKLYVKHPLLTLGMVSMYLALTVVGCLEIIGNKMKTA